MLSEAPTEGMAWVFDSSASNARCGGDYGAMCCFLCCYFPKKMSNYGLIKLNHVLLIHLVLYS